MTPAEALGVIRGLAGAGRVSYARHAFERMDERGVTRNDVDHALLHAAQCAWQPRRETWKVIGADLSGDELVMAVVVDDGLLIVTVF